MILTTLFISFITSISTIPHVVACLSRKKIVQNNSIAEFGEVTLSPPIMKHFVLNFVRYVGKLATYRVAPLWFGVGIVDPMRQLIQFAQNVTLLYLPRSPRYSSFFLCTETGRWCSQGNLDKNHHNLLNYQLYIISRKISYH